VRLAREALGGERVREPVLVEGEESRDSECSTGPNEMAIAEDVRIREIDGALKAIFRHRRVQKQRSLVMEAQLELMQEAGAVMVKAELAARETQEIPASIGNEEGVTMLEHELGKIGGDARGEDVVAVADDEIVFGSVRCHARVDRVSPS